MKHILTGMIAVTLLYSCSNHKNDYDASGHFEADEVIVSAQQSGELLSYTVTEGTQLTAGAVVGQIDVTIPKLQKEQTEAAITALKQKTTTSAEQIAVVKKQLAVQQSQLDHLYHEQQRTQNLVNADAAPRKQLDDISAQIDQVQKQIAATRQQIGVYRNNTYTHNESIWSEKAPLEKTAEQFQAQIDKGQIVNPINGTVLTNYALKGEVAVAGKPLYKIANTDTLTLRAYITGDQLLPLKGQQPVQVRIDNGGNKYKTYRGIITWISDKSEFTPKTIQTKDERANLVYAIKVKVKNDGYLKIGMYGEVLFNEPK